MCASVIDAIAIGCKSGSYYRFRLFEDAGDEKLPPRFKREKIVITNLSHVTIGDVVKRSEILSHSHQVKNELEHEKLVSQSQLIFVCLYRYVNAIQK